MKTATIHHDRAVDHWLTGTASPTDAPPFGRALDSLLGEAPDAAEWEAVGRRLRARLEDRMGRVYYDQLKSTLVGPLWVAVTDHGLAAVSFGGSGSAFAEWIGGRLGASPIRSTERTGAARRELEEYLAGRRTAFSVPVDLRHVTPFQRDVLQAARAVPRGQVATYAEIGRRIGRPRAARAVGQALGSNPVPIVVPCHRVLASDGSLGGYSGRGGIRTKLRLLRLEGAALLS